MKHPSHSPRRRASDDADRSRRWFADLLWRAFPGPSEREVSAAAAAALGVSDRQVRNWLRCRHDAGLRHVLAVIAIAGAEVVFRRMERDR